MTREEIIMGLETGHTLYLDGAATAQDRSTVQALIDEGIAKSKFCEGNQYGYYKITLNDSKVQTDE